MKLTDYDSLARLASAHLRPGVRANTMVSQGEYGPALAAGALTAWETPAGLLLLRDRGNHARLHFFLEDLSAPLGAALPDPTVTEVAYRPRDKGLQEAVDYLTRQGFALCLERVRLSRKAGQGEETAEPVSRPGPEAGPVVLAFLRENFSSLTGCLPNEAELAGDLAARRVLTLEEDGRITGLLHFTLEGNTGEIRHLAVAAGCRGTGRTRPLLAAYLQAIGGAKSIVWTGAEDQAAQAAYSRFGFAPDGRRSAVLCYSKKEG
ncbi:MAG TPA: GNAT family N-acetyltransferase [Candidatus Evtepia faecavium]|nr:GNAT family N-acetyltransferase [Candidatus Evtepia faecavium]